MLDLDGLKPINDTLGHAAGDHAIIDAVNSWLRQIRSHDLLARLGGDEFGLLMPGCDADAARTLLERIRETTPEPRVSCGVASLLVGERGSALVERADAALNEARQAGRDRVLTALPRTGRITHPFRPRREPPRSCSTHE